MSFVFDYRCLFVRIVNGVNVILASLCLVCFSNNMSNKCGRVDLDILRHDISEREFRQDLNILVVSV